MKRIDDAEFNELRRQGKSLKEITDLIYSRQMPKKWRKQEMKKRHKERINRA